MPLPFTHSDRVDVSQLQDNVDAMRLDLEAAVGDARAAAEVKTDDTYAPTTPGDWDGGASAPSTIGEALDRIAAAIKTAHGTGP